MNGAPSSRKQGIVVLYTTLVHYFVAVLEELARVSPRDSIDVIHYDRKTSSSSNYLLADSKNVHYFGRSGFDRAGIYAFLVERRPDIIYVSGWSDNDYVDAIRKYRKLAPDVSVVAGIDDQWFGSLRQLTGKFVFPFLYRNVFDFFWVSGKPQYSYAQQFGYDHEHIICNLLAHDPAIRRSAVTIERRFVFVGRFVQQKGLELLVEAYTRLPGQVRAEWPLVLIGDGPLMGEIRQRTVSGIEFRGFLQLPELLSELSNGGVGCVASVREPWGVAIHEMAAMGYPLILSSSCGAATEFLIPGYNGYLFKNGSVDSLYSALVQIIRLSETDFDHFSNHSEALSRRITSEQSANSLLSVRRLREL